MRPFASHVVAADINPTTDPTQLELLTLPSSKRVLACLPQKTGSTAWKTLLLLALTGERTATEAWNFHGFLQKHNRSDAISHASVAQLVSDDSVEKLLLVRNPYQRLLSAYLDKVVWAGCPPEFDARCPPGVNANSSFAELVDALVEEKAHGRQVDPHFAPISSFWQACMRADPRVLKFEEMGLWYGPVVRKLGLETQVAHGWAGDEVDEHHIHTSGGDCFFRPCGVTCADALAPLDASDARCTTASLVPASSSADELAEHYADPRIVAKVHELMEGDFSAFGYDSRLPTVSQWSELLLGGHALV